MSTSPLSINCAGRLLTFDRPRVMGVLNVTPDSFHDGGRYDGRVDAALTQASAMLEAGASVVDIGGASSRPGAAEVDADTEAARILPVVEAIAAAHPEAIISIDTYRGAIARAAVAAGATLINDISAGTLDEDLLAAVVELRVPYVLMHMRGTPPDMQADPRYDDVTVEVYDALAANLASLRAAGVVDVVIDPGFGFGKTVEHNYTLLARLGDFRFLGCPVLVGLSRKRMVCAPLGVSPARALNGTTALHMAALERGANLLRVHDVCEAVEAIELYTHLRAADPDSFGTVPLA